MREPALTPDIKLAGRPPHNADYTAELPYPATKLVITKHLFISPSPLAFGLHILGTFFDKDNNKVWEKELYVFHQDSRGISIDANDLDDGPSPPQFALEGKSCGLLLTARGSASTSLAVGSVIV